MGRYGEIWGDMGRYGELSPGPGGRRAGRSPRPASHSAAALRRSGLRRCRRRALPGAALAPGHGERAHRRQWSSGARLRGAEVGCLRGRRRGAVGRRRTSEATGQRGVRTARREASREASQASREASRAAKQGGEAGRPVEGIGSESAPRAAEAVRAAASARTELSSSVSRLMQVCSCAIAASVARFASPMSLVTRLSTGSARTTALVSSSVPSGGPAGGGGGGGGGAAEALPSSPAGAFALREATREGALAATRACASANLEPCLCRSSYL